MIEPLSLADDVRLVLSGNDRLVGGAAEPMKAQPTHHRWIAIKHVPMSRVEQ
jgi:hypothetical protein